MKSGRLEELGIYLSVLSLMILGLTTLSGISPSSVVFKQLLWNVLGLSMIILLNVLRVRDFKYIGNYILWISVVALVAVLLIGPEVNGARRWFQFKYFSIQPSEVAKIGFVLLIPHWIAEKKLSSFLKSGVVTAIVSFLILLEPDLGTAAMFLGLWMVLIFASGAFDRPLLWTVGTVTASIPLIFFKVLKGYQRERILAFIYPSRYTQGAAYNVIQSMRAIGSGGFFGKGLGGEMSHRGYIPMARTDFIFSSLGEQWGFLGIAAVLGIYTFVFYILFRAMTLARSREDAMVILGITTLLFFHVFENAGMNMGLLPVTGIPLPFVSYGGSSTLAFSFLMGVVVRIVSLGTRAKPSKT